MAVLLGSVVSAAPQVVVPASDINALKREYTFVRFSQLTHMDGSSSAQSLIPAPARAFHGKKVSIRGYVVPVDVNRDGISEFILSSNIDSCHFGIIGGPDEWIYVTMAEGRRMPRPGIMPVTVFGVLQVGEDMRLGAVDSLYRMRGERVAIH